jgi:predicted RNase H-like nuclease
LWNSEGCFPKSGDRLDEILSEMTVAIGIDGCKSGWLYFRFDECSATFGVADTVAEILADETGETRALIDIPIGLKERGKTERQCDLEARALLSPKRHSSVFPAPCRQALKQGSFAASSEKNRKITGRGLSRQTWGLVPKIREVDELLIDNPELRTIVREAHPELLFRGLAGGPMSHRKATREGFDERMTILNIFEPNTKVLVAAAFLAHGGYDATRDDIVDAFALALCARHPGRLKTIPNDPPLDPKGLSMQMVYMPR